MHKLKGDIKKGTNCNTSSIQSKSSPIMVEVASPKDDTEGQLEVQVSHENTVKGLSYSKLFYLLDKIKLTSKINYENPLCAFKKEIRLKKRKNTGSGQTTSNHVTPIIPDIIIWKIRGGGNLAPTGRQKAGQAILGKPQNFQKKLFDK
ncbi:hypothetical protein CIPAW_08G110200 [Carya illinoinensis]|uniref:Uncharacterized protein n=1 Tax=Carya illinoinensis TaxID=32201 RepID=A0A8T1PUF9_CARIL|nr:hypothetical protein CIPAW_08G110200 [Carya illinoinensis]